MKRHTFLKKNTMTQEELKKMPMSEVKNFIRQTLSFKNVYPHLSDDIRHMDAEQIAKEHLRFEMSGLDIDSVSRNMNILNRFEYLGIYDCVDCLFLKFHKGIPKVTIQYRNDDECHWYEFPGFTTTEIIYEIFKLTIFSKKTTSRILLKFQKYRKVHASATSLTINNTTP